MGTTDADRRAQQFTMAKRLKAVVIVLAVLGGFATVGVIGFRFMVPRIFGTSTTFFYDNGGGVEYSQNMALYHGLVGYSVFTLFAAAMCYKILWHFWHVCTEIGRDNSFSAENYRSFHKMANTSFVISGSYALKLAFIGGRMLLLSHAVVETVCVSCVIFAGLVAFLLFGIICEALSKLIQNAYEIKAENDLTI